MWEKVKTLIGSAAPLVGTLLGGPAGGVAGGLVASALGVENSPKAIEAALVDDPQAFVKLKAMEQAYTVELQKLALEVRRAELADTQDARAQHKDHWMPSLLVLLLCAMVTGMFAALFFGEPSKDYAQVLIMIVGTVLGAFGTGIAFWLGSSKGSADKSKQLKIRGG